MRPEAGRPAALGWAAAFLLIALAYTLSLPGNRMESFDGYNYSLIAEADPYTLFRDTRLMLFHVVSRTLWLDAKALGFDISAYWLLAALNIIGASAALLLLVRLLTRRFGLARATAWLSAGLLGVSYGFWRFAVEAEVYVVSIALIVACLELALAAEDRAVARGRRPRLAGPALLAGVTVLVYQPNAIPLFLAYPIVLLRRDRLVPLVVYGGVGGAVILGGYVAAFLLADRGPLTVAALLGFVNERGGEFHHVPLAFGLVWKSLLSIGHNIASTNWLYGFAAFRDLIAETLPGRQTAPLVLTASRAGAVIWLPLVALPALVAASLWLVVRAVAARAPRPGGRRRILFVALWFVLYALVVGRLDAAQFEPWIMALPPLVILAGAWLVEPVVRAGRPAPAIAVLAALALHNVANMAMLRDPSADWYRLRSDWLARHACPGDFVLMAMDDYPLETRIRYRTRAEVWSVERQSPGAALPALERARAQGRRVYLLDDVLTTPAPVVARAPGLVPVLTALADEMRPVARPVGPGAAGTVYALAGAAPPCR